jgi:hypothetical protein
MAGRASADGGDSSRLLRRLFALSARYRRECLLVLAFQLALLALGLGGLGLTGLA